MILAYITQLSTSQNMIMSAARLATALDKPLGVFSLESDMGLQQIIDECQLTNYRILSDSQTSDITSICEDNEAAFLFLQLEDNGFFSLKKYLSECRDLRIPYVLFYNKFDVLNVEKVLLPITFLEEDLEKAQFASAFGRFCHSEIIMLQANDYGTKAANNANKMITLFEKFNFNYSVSKGNKDSFKVEMEAVQMAVAKNAGMVIVSASREYGLDDVLFGPKELHILKKAQIPVLLINPRADLYTLCD